MLCAPRRPRDSDRGEHIELCSRERADDRPPGDLPPVRVRLSVEHDEIVLVECAGVPERQLTAVETPVVDDSAPAERAVADQYRNAVEIAVHDLVEVEDLDRISPRPSAFSFVADDEIVVLEPVPSRRVIVLWCVQRRDRVLKGEQPIFADLRKRNRPAVERIEVHIAQRNVADRQVDAAYDPAGAVRGLVGRFVAPAAARDCDGSDHRKRNDQHGCEESPTKIRHTQTIRPMKGPRSPAPPAALIRPPAGS